MSARAVGESVPLLRTKLYVPRPRPESIRRPHLVERLNEAVRHGYKLALVSAPAGFGKTMLVSEWVHSSDENVAWLSLDVGDNDPTRFWTYVVTALQEVLPSLGEDALSALRATDLTPVSDRLSAEVILSGLINEISQRIQVDLCGKPRCVLVLDDYHLIETRAVHEMLAFFLEHMPRGLCLMIATRSDPPLPLSRLRGRGQLVELRQADLRFTNGEVGEFLRRTVREGLSDQEILAWTKRTEGWIAGLQMAALAMRPTGVGAERVGALRGERYILDYLVEEVLAQQPEAIRSFLLQTSILSRLTAPLCSAVVEMEGGGRTQYGELQGEPVERTSQEILDYLERENLFVVALDDRREWYRYHFLFADLLQHRLGRSQPGLVPILHGRASAWYEARAELVDSSSARGELMAAAIDHAFKARDLDLAACLIETGLADAMWNRGEIATVTGWLDELPQSLIEARPKLGAYGALLSLVEGQADMAERRIEIVERNLNWENWLPSIEAGPDALPTAVGPVPNRDQAELLCLVASVRASIGFLRQEAEIAVRYARWSLANLPKESGLWRCVLTMILGDTMAWYGELDETRRLYEEALSMSASVGSSYLRFGLRVRIASILWFSGRLRQMETWCRQTLELFGEGNLIQQGSAAKFFAVWGDVLREQNDLDRALEYTRRAYKVSKLSQNVGGMVLSHICLARVLLARGDLSAVQRVEGELRALAIESGWPAWFRVAIVNAMVAARLLAGVIDAADVDETTRQGFQRAGESEEFPLYLNRLIRSALLQLYILEEKYEQAVELLDRSVSHGEAHSQGASLVDLSAFRALVCQAQGQDEAAMRALARALSVAESEGHVRTFLDGGDPMARLLYQAASQGISPEYAGRLLAAFELEAGLGKIEEPPRPPAPAGVEALTEREIEVLELVAEGLTNREVAQHLFLSVSTVKVHTYNIYSKLDVHNRTQAVAKARVLGILPST